MRRSKNFDKVKRYYNMERDACPKCRENELDHGRRI